MTGLRHVKPPPKHRPRTEASANCSEKGPIVRVGRRVDQRQLDLALAAIHACATRKPEAER